MFDRDGYWREKIARLIREFPGITQSQLSAKTRKLTTQERHGYLYELRDAGRVRFGQVDVRGGLIAHTFWPVAAATAQTPADQLTAQLNDAKRLLTAGVACIEKATRIVNEINAAANGPTPDVRTAADVRTAIMPADGAELRSAC
jgi:hypothetical protein